MSDILLAYGQESARGSLLSTKRAPVPGQLSVAYSDLPEEARDDAGLSSKDARLYFDLSANERIPVNAYFADYALYASRIEAKSSNKVKSYILGMDASNPTDSTPYYDTDVYLTATAGQVAMKQLLITSTTGVGHITFSRTNSYNYIYLPSDSGSIAFCLNSSVSAAGSQLVINKDSITPGTTKAVSLGTSSLLWNNGYFANVDTNTLEVNETSNFIGEVYIKGGADFTATLQGPTADATFLFPGTGGTLVTHATRGTAVGSSTKPVYVQTTGQVKACSTYAGGTKVTLNGTSKGATTASIYAPTTFGTDAYVLVARGENAAPEWIAQTALTDVFENLTSTTAKNLTIQLGGTKKEIEALYASALSNTTAIGSSTKPVYFNASGQPVACSTYGGGTKITLNNVSKAASDATFYAPSTGGTDEYILVATGANTEPEWRAQTDLAGLFQALNSTTAANLTIRVGGEEKEITALYASALSNTSAIGSSTKPVYFNASGQPVACNTYGGGTKITLNNVSKASSDATFYAPSTGGTDEYILVATGATSEPEWRAQNNLPGLFETLTSTTATNLTVKVGGTEKTITALYASALSNTAAIGGTTKPVYFNASGQPVAGSDYAGGTKVTLNGTSKGASTASFYAPTAAGTSGQVLTSSGGAPSWTDQTALTSVFQALSSTTSTNLTVKVGGTEKTITALYASALSNTTAIGGTSKPVYFNASGQPVAGSDYAGGTKVTLNGSSKGASTASFYAPTGAGTSGQYLRSSGGAPSWSDIIKIQVLTSDPSSPEVGQLWINTSA